MLPPGPVGGRRVRVGSTPWFMHPEHPPARDVPVGRGWPLGTEPPRAALLPAPPSHSALFPQLLSSLGLFFFFFFLQPSRCHGNGDIPSRAERRERGCPGPPRTRAGVPRVRDPADWGPPRVGNSPGVLPFQRKEQRDLITFEYLLPVQRVLSGKEIPSGMNRGGVGGKRQDGP